MPARSMSWWETISASFGVSRRTGRKKRVRRMGGVSVDGSVRLREVAIIAIAEPTEANSLR
jgi:hypothetical protein